MSLDCVEMSLGNVFECGQAYVALSRATSLKGLTPPTSPCVCVNVLCGIVSLNLATFLRCSFAGLRVVDFDRSCVRADANVIKFYEQIDPTCRSRALGDVSNRSDSVQSNQSSQSSVHW